MKFNKIKALLIAGAVLSLAGVAYASDLDKTDRGQFYMAMSSINKSSAYSVFLKEQYLATKCGKVPSVDTLKNYDPENSLAIMRALDAGDYEAAKRALDKFPCE